MDMRTGEIATMDVFERRGVSPHFLRPIVPCAEAGRTMVYRGTVMRPIPLEGLSESVRTKVVQTGKGFVTRNSCCPCGSGKRFKRCCMVEV